MALPSQPKAAPAEPAASKVEAKVPTEPQKQDETPPEGASKIHGASNGQFDKLKALVKKAAANPTKENIEAVQQMEMEMRNTKGKYHKPTVKQMSKQMPSESEESASAPESTPKTKKPAVLFNLDIDSLGSIPVHAGDAAAPLAKEFAAKHKLSDKMASKLEQMIAQQMSAHHMDTGSN